MKITHIIVLLLIALIFAVIVFFGMNNEYRDSLPINVPNWLPHVAAVTVFFTGFFFAYSKSKKKESL